MHAGVGCVFAFGVLAFPGAAVAQEPAMAPAPTPTEDAGSPSSEPAAPPPPASPAALPPLPGAAPEPTPPSASPPSPSVPPSPSTPTAPSIFDHLAPPPARRPESSDGIFAPGSVPNREVDVFVSASLGVDWLRQVPRLSLDEGSSWRGVGGTKLPSAGSLAMWRAQVGLDLALWRRWTVPLVGVAGGAALGPSDRAVTSADGSFVQMRPWTTGIVTLLGPGLGLRFTHKRWTVAGNARVALSYLWMGTNVATGSSVSDVSSSAWVPSVRVDLEACRRIGPLDRACLYVETRAYDATAMNGGSAGVRWEFGK
jgi:hypothetical protein